MSPTSLRVLLSTRSVSRSRRGASLLVAAALSLTIGACATGTVTTSAGAVVPAATVQAQDITGDALSVLQDVHNAAVRAHDAKAGAEPADVHAKRRAALLASASGLRAAWDGLSAWKLGSEGAGMVAVVGRVRDALPEMLDAAVALGVVSREYADAIGAFFGTASQGLIPKPLAKVPVVSVLSPEDEIDWRKAVLPVHRYSTVVQPDGYYDGCNWHRPLGNGVWASTAMHCGGPSTVTANDLWVKP